MRPPIQTKESGFLRVKFENVDADAGIFEGYGSVFGVVDQGGDVVERGAFAASLAEHKRRGTTPLMLWAHKSDVPIGRWLSIEEDSIGLLVRGQLNLKTTAGRDAHAHVTDGDVSGLSIGFRVPPDGSEYTSQGVTRLKTVDLVEVSVVTVPMNDQARIRVGSKGELAQLLRKAGLPAEAARRVADGGFPALSSSPDNSNELAAILKAVEASARRMKGL